MLLKFFVFAVPYTLVRVFAKCEMFHVHHCYKFRMFNCLSENAIMTVLNSVRIPVSLSFAPPVNNASWT